MTDVAIENDNPADQQQPDQTPAQPEPEDARDVIRQARSLIPVGPAGATPINFAQQVDVAKTMAQSRFSIPQFLCGNAGDCLAIIDIASRANLSPYMVATMCYVEPKSKRLSFMSQLYHALLIQSRMLVGDLEISYAGDGDERTCTVSGKLRSDGKVRTHTSPPLGKVRPPKNQEGQTKGSPLWVKKPDVQLFYDTSRDWTRIYCPTATLGIFAPEEFVETPVDPENAKDVTPALKDRIRSAPRGDEGFRDDHAARELSQIASAKGEVAASDPPQKTAPGKGAEASAGATAPAATPTRKTPERARAAAKAATRPSGKARHRVPSKPPSKAAVKAAVDRAETSAKAKAKSPSPKGEAEKPPAKSDLKTAAQYIAYAKAWIVAATGQYAAQSQWDEERALRDELKVAIKDRRELEDRIVLRFEA